MKVANSSFHHNVNLAFMWHMRFLQWRLQQKFYQSKWHHIPKDNHALWDQLDATIMIYWSTLSLTCFGHHYADLQERKAVYNCVWFLALNVLGSRSCVHTTCFPASQDSSQHIKCQKPYAVIYGLALLKMGIMVPETCWAKCWSINHNCCIKLVSQTTCLPASQDFSQHIKCRKPYAVIYGLALLKMGIMVPETCSAKCWSINHNCCIKLVSQIISY